MVDDEEEEADELEMRELQEGAVMVAPRHMVLFRFHTLFRHFSRCVR